MASGRIMTLFLVFTVISSFVKADTFCKLLNDWPSQINVSRLIIEINQLPGLPTDYFELLPDFQAWPIAGWGGYETLTGDLNGDGRTDLIWNIVNASANAMYVGLSNGDGTFNLLPDFQAWPFGGWGGYETLTGDLNGDGRTDLIWNIVNTSANAIYVGLAQIIMICLL